MTERPQASAEDLAADYVRASMRVAMPDGMIPEVMRTVAEMPQARRSWFASFSPLLATGAAAAVTAVVIAIGLFITSPRNVAAPDPTTTPEPTAMAAPTLTPEGAWIPPRAPMTSFQQLPSPLPSPAPTFEATADADADALFAETQTCHRAEMGVTITFPASWHTNEVYKDLPACTMFGPDPIDAELMYTGYTGDHPPIYIYHTESWIGTEQPGLPVASLARAPLGDRIAWLITYRDSEAESYGYLVPLTDDAYGPFLQPFLRVATGAEHRPTLERMLLLLEFDQ